LSRSFFAVFGCSIAVPPFHRAELSAITAALEQAVYKPFALSGSTQCLQRVRWNGDDPDDLSVIQQDQTISLLDVMALANGSRDIGLPLLDH
jgi:hypothetical protein